MVDRGDRLSQLSDSSEDLSKCLNTARGVKTVSTSCVTGKCGPVFLSVDVKDKSDPKF